MGMCEDGNCPECVAAREKRKDQLNAGLDALRDRIEKLSPKKQPKKPESNSLIQQVDAIILRDRGNRYRAWVETLRR